MTGPDPSWPGLGFDPAPGDPAAVTELSTVLRRVAAHLGSLHGTLSRISDHQGGWTGPAADAFSGALGRLPDYLRDASDSVTAAYGALDTWYRALAEHQPRAAALERAAVAARQHEAQALRAHTAAAADPGLEPSAADATDGGRYGARYDAARRRLDTAAAVLRGAADELEHLRTQAAALRTAHGGDAHRAAEAIRRAADGKAPPEPGPLEEVGAWFARHGADLLAVAAGTAGVAAVFFPPLALAAATLSLAAAGAHAAQYGVDGLWPPAWKNLGNYLALSGDALGAFPLLGAVGRGGLAAFEAGARAGVAETVSAVGEVKYLDPQNPLFRVAVERPALAFGVPLERAQDLADGIQAAGSLALTAPAAATLTGGDPDGGLTGAVNVTTGAANVMGGTGLAWSGGGPAKVVGGVLAVGNAFALYGWTAGHDR